MSNITQSECKKCGKPVFWHLSRNQKHYPCNSDNRRDFHKCGLFTDAAEPDPGPHAQSGPAGPDWGPAPAPDFEPTLEERVSHLEKAVIGLTRTVLEIEKRQPIDSSDVDF